LALHVVSIGKKGIINNFGEEYLENAHLNDQGNGRITLKWISGK